MVGAFVHRRNQMTRAGRLAVSFAAVAALLSNASAYGAATVVEIGMINKPDGTQFMILGRGTVRSGPIHLAAPGVLGVGCG